MEIRIHGRGGQGGVTCAKIIATLHARLGKSVQAFGDYAGERSGAPVRAYVRVADAPIEDRNKVYQPDVVIVLDPTLLTASALDGLAVGGMLLLNTSRDPDAGSGQFRVGAVDATEIARRHGIGSRSLVIVNTTIAGAYVRVTGLAWEVLEQTLRDLHVERDLPAAREAYDQVQVREPIEVDKRLQAPIAPPTTAPAVPRVIPLIEHVEGPRPVLKTGAWRTQRPKYVERLAPCRAQCPAGNDVIGFVQALARDGEVAAAEILGRTTPFPGVCGRVCPAPCMERCNRRDYDGAVNVRSLERWVSDRAGPRPPEARRATRPHRLAVVGAGPAGLSAAYALALAGHRAVVLDAGTAPGGILREGIPGYRLPRDVLDREVAAIHRLGVEIRTGTRVDRSRLASLLRTFDAVILASGLQRPRALEVRGGTIRGIEQGLRFLKRLSAGDEVRLNGHVVVVGGGNTAIDCARSALRSGAARVTVAYRRTRSDMPALPEEILEAEREGVEMLFQRQPAGFTGDGQVRGIDLAEVEMGPPDEGGRSRPIVTDRVKHLPCDSVLLALGQSADLSLVPNDAINIFLAGDLGGGEGTVAHAIGDGRRAAGLALRSLGAETEAFAREDPAQAVPPSGIRFGHFPRVRSQPEQEAQAAGRLRHGIELHRGIEDGRGEARRCFSCGHCTRCDTCLVYCPEGIIRRNGVGYIVDLEQCKGCGICVAECPRTGMEMVNG